MCENCKGFLTRKPTGTVEPGTDERVPNGCLYWTCKKCGHQTIHEIWPPRPLPSGTVIAVEWRTLPF